MSYEASVEALKKFLESSKELPIDLTRFLLDGVEYVDFLKICAKIRTMKGKSMGEWCSVWMDEALIHQRIAEKALAEGNKITAGEGFWRASIYNHYGQFLEWHNPIRHEAARRKVETYKRAAPLIVPPAERVEVQFESISLPAYMRLPIGKRKPPCVICIGGLESSKEEYYTFENMLLKRGLATFSFDGPGQCEVYYKMKARPDFDKATSAVVDYLQTREDIDADRLGAIGRSLGGYYLLRSVAFEKRIRAAVAWSSVDFESTWDRHTSGIKDGWAYISGKENWDEAKEYFMSFTLKGIADKITCPLYILQGKKDEINPTETAVWISKQVRGPVTLDIEEEGGHCVHNLGHIVRPRMTDWLAKTLGS